MVTRVSVALLGSAVLPASVVELDSAELLAMQVRVEQRDSAVARASAEAWGPVVRWDPAEP